MRVARTIQPLLMILAALTLHGCAGRDSDAPELHAAHAVDTAYSVAEGERLVVLINKVRVHRSDEKERTSSDVERKSFFLNTVDRRITPLPHKVKAVGGSDARFVGVATDEDCCDGDTLLLYTYDVSTGTFDSTRLRLLDAYQESRFSPGYPSTGSIVINPASAIAWEGSEADSAFAIIDASGKVTTLIGIDAVTRALRTERGEGPIRFAWTDREYRPSGGDGGPNEFDRIHVVDVRSGTRSVVDSQLLSLANILDVEFAPFSLSDVAWTEKGELSYFLYHNRGDSIVHVLYDPTTGTRRLVPLASISSGLPHSVGRRIRFIDNEMYVAGDRHIDKLVGGRLVEVFRLKDEEYSIEEVFILP